jgi:SHAQKYF class myb-like DNA-binding protein
MNLVLSTDAKPRLKWTPELHQRFVEAVHKLGGPDKATPKNLMREMEIPRLTLYHLKSHLQKFRLGKNQSSIDNKQDDADYGEIQSSEGNFNMSINDITHSQINENVEISQALHMQIEVQRKLHEQIEVQRHLQLRIEAQGKYLQTVLKKAQDTLAGYSSNSVGVEIAKAELSRLVSMVNSGCQSSSLASELTEAGGGSNIEATERKQMRSSMESSLTSSESSGRNEEEKQLMNENGETCKWNTYLELSLMNSSISGKKRIVPDSICVEQELRKRSVLPDKNCNKLKTSGLLERFDLNAPVSD